MRITTEVLVIAVLFSSFVGIVSADVAPPSTQTVFYFQKDKQPLRQPVEFTIECYGVSAMDNDGELIKISDFSGRCNTFGCKFDTSNIFSVYRKNTKYCDLSGEVNGEKFVINDFLGKSMSGLKCQGADFDISKGDKYYKKTSKYENCMDAVRKEYYPDNKNFTCHQSLVEVPKNECAGYGYIIINGVCHKFTDETKTCIAEKQQKENLCDQYLEDVSSAVEKFTSGHLFSQACEVEVDISDNTSDNQQQEPDSKTFSSFFIRIIDFIKCSFFKVLGKSC